MLAVTTESTTDDDKTVAVILDRPREIDEDLFTMVLQYPKRELYVLSNDGLTHFYCVF